MKLISDNLAYQKINIVFYYRFHQSNTGGPRRPEDKQEILVYHHPVQLKRDDSNRSSSRSSTFSRETASRGSGRSLKDEHQGALKMYDMRGEEPTRGSGRRKQVPAHETTTYRTVEGYVEMIENKWHPL